MTITRRPFHNEADLPRLFELVQALPLSCRHVLDLSWRLSALQDNSERDVACWEDSTGKLVGFAAWQIPWAMLDFFILPGTTQQAVETEVFAWANGRFREHDEERGYPLPYRVDFRDDDLARRQLIEAHGFLLDDGDSYTLFQHTLDSLAPAPALPNGFTLRPLAGEQEAAAYSELHRAAFESASMTPRWRGRTLRMPQYRPELDLVVAAPCGELAAFCVGWFDPERQLAQIEPIGVHPRFRRRGLARVLLLEMLHRFKAHGATSAFIEPFSDNTHIHRASESVGFQRVHTVHARGKWVNQPAPG